MKATTFSGRAFYLIYGAFFWPLLRALFSVAGVFVPKIREGLRMRRSKPWLLPSNLASTLASPLPAGSDVVWFHCASGEFEYAKSVITELKKRSPETQVLVTYFSPTYAKVVSRFPGVDHSCPLPWDTPNAMNELIDSFRPRCLMIARTDTWPELLRSAKRHGLRTLLFAATLPATAGRIRNPLTRWMSRSLFAYLDRVFCVDESDVAQFSRLGLGSRVEAAGDTRYDQVMARLKSPKALRTELFSNSRPTLICGSTWPEDEAVLVELASQVREADYILVPHEPNEPHLETLENQLKEKGLTSVRYSTAASWPEGAILIVDKMGILAELYQVGDYAFVGGSFRKTVHSVMEPLASGSLTFVGPLHHNNREALEFKELGFVREVTSAASFIKAFRDEIGLQSESKKSRAETIRGEVHRRSGKSARVVEWILNPNDPPSQK